MERLRTWMASMRASAGSDLRASKAWKSACSAARGHMAAGASARGARSSALPRSRTARWLAARQAASTSGRWRVVKGCGAPGAFQATGMSARAAASVAPSQKPGPAQVPVPVPVPWVSYSAMKVSGWAWMM